MVPYVQVSLWSRVTWREGGLSLFIKRLWFWSWLCHVLAVEILGKALLSVSGTCLAYFPDFGDQIVYEACVWSCLLNSVCTEGNLSCGVRQIHVQVWTQLLPRVGKFFILSVKLGLIYLPHTFIVTMKFLNACKILRISTRQRLATIKSYEEWGL